MRRDQVATVMYSLPMLAALGALVYVGYSVWEVFRIRYHSLLPVLLFIDVVVLVACVVTVYYSFTSWLDKGGS